MGDASQNRASPVIAVSKAACLCQLYNESLLHENEHSTNVYTVPALWSPGSTRTTSSVTHRGGGDTYATGAISSSTKKMRGRDYISIATWHVKTLAQAGRLQEVTHRLDRHTWHVDGLCEVRWTNFGEHPTEKRHTLYYSGELDSHTRGVGFLVSKNIKNSVPACPLYPAGSFPSGSEQRHSASR